VIGNPIMPVVKISGNPRTVRTMSEHIDVDVTGVLRREMTIDQAGDALIDMVIRTCSGRITAAEALRHREFTMTKLYRSAGGACAGLQTRWCATASSAAVRWAASTS
jgi:(2R)-sulfolactate sulfo-lyase subunit beta